MMYSIKSLVDANTLQTRAKRVLLSVCRVQLSFCKYKQKVWFYSDKRKHYFKYNVLLFTCRITKPGYLPYII